jgi:hypothetical protein
MPPPIFNIRSISLKLILKLFLHDRRVKIYPEKVGIPFDRSDELEHFERIASLVVVVDCYQLCVAVQAELRGALETLLLALIWWRDVITFTIVRIERPVGLTFLTRFGLLVPFIFVISNG